jgi:hypothetical protein
MISNVEAASGRTKPELLIQSMHPDQPGLALIRDSKLEEPTGAGFSVGWCCPESALLQNWKRRPTVGSIEDLCRKPLARPFDTCDHMIPKYASKRFANL